jgi:hypothetical protein
MYAKRPALPSSIPEEAQYFREAHTLQRKPSTISATSTNRWPMQDLVLKGAQNSV